MHNNCCEKVVAAEELPEKNTYFLLYQNSFTSVVGLNGELYNSFLNKNDVKKPQHGLSTDPLGLYYL